MSVEGRFRMSLFGYPVVYDVDGARIAIGMRATALLAMVALEPDGVSRARLAQLLWPDRQVEQARASLRQCLVEMRHAFARHRIAWPITADARLVVLSRTALDSDLSAIRSACLSQDRAALTLALRATPARPLLDELQPSSAFVDWVVLFRRKVSGELERALAAIFARNERAFGEKDWAESAALAHARLLHEPSCPLATAVLRGRPIPLEAVQQRPALRPLPLPPEAPPAIYIAAPGDSDAALELAIHEEIVSALSRFREFRVVILGAGVEPPPVGKDASAFLLSVTLRPAIAGMVAIARLSSVDAGDVLWGARFAIVGDTLDRALDEIVERIAAAIAPTVETHLAVFARERPSGALYSRYLAARSQSQRPPDHLTAREAAHELEQIVEQAPRFASAQLALARLYNTDFAWTEAMSSGDAERARALMLARAAVASDRAHAQGHSVLGWCHLRQHEWAAARQCFDEAVRLNPYHAERLMEVAYGLIHLGDLDTGEALLRRCLAINPVTSDGFYFDLGMLALIRGDPLLASEQFAMIVAPDVWGSIAAALAAVQGGAVAEPAVAAGRQAVVSIWPGNQMPSTAVLRSWIETRHPFRLPQHLERYVAGFERVFAG